MQYQTERCSKCTLKRPIINRKYKLCNECNYERLHPEGRKTYELNRTEIKRNTTRIAPRSKRHKLDQSVQRFNNQTELFAYVWDTREHTSELSRERLDAEIGSEEWFWYFSHLLPKGQYTEVKLDPENIILKTQAEHWDWHNIPRSKLEKQEKWKPIFIRYDKARLDYNRRYRAGLHSD